ncbi:MAG: hypothetical protein ABI321_06685 [Polyangia bacterium]
MILMFVFIVPPVAYGWGYRGWGAPYPRYLQRRRAGQALASGRDPSFDAHSWSWGGDLVWVLCSIWVCWAVAAYFWR